MGKLSDSRKPKSSRANARIVALCLAIAMAMGGLAYASAPLYRLFCQVTGYAGTTQRAETGPAGALGRMVTVRFDANIAPGLNWRFGPMQREVTVRLGEIATIRYVAENLSLRPVTGTATFNVTPESTGVYFNKMQCFCFNETTLAPGEILEMPVVFFVDPEMVDSEEAGEIRTITLSYTFFDTGADAPLAAARKPASGG